jgi:hypothetical protein
MTSPNAPVAVLAHRVAPRQQPSRKPDDDLSATLVDGRWRFTHPDGRTY